MDISDLLSPALDNAEPPAAPPEARVVPDNKRKRPYRMSVSQVLSRRQHEAHESRVLNLTLDINQLKQQVQYLTECRDLYLTRLFLRRQHLEGAVLGATQKLVGSFSGRGPSLTASQRSALFTRERMKGLDGGGGTHQLVLERGTHIFSHRSWTSTSTKVLLFVEDDEDAGEEADETRRMCGDSAGCVVEAAGVFSGRIKRELLAGFFPHVLQDQELVHRLVGFQLTIPVQLILYYSEGRRITHQVAQFNVLASLDPLRDATPNDYAALMRKTSN